VSVSPPPRRAAFVFVLVTVVLDMLAFGMIVPILPKLVEDMLGGDTARAAELYGVFGTAWALMQFGFSPVLGTLSDRFGRRPVILLSNLGLGLDYVLMAWAPTLPWLFAGRVISGITASSFSTAGAYIADVTPPEKRASAFGMLGAAFGVGFVLGPAVGGLLGHVSPRLPFAVAAALSLANALYGFFILPESLAKERRMAFAWRRANPVGALALLRSHRELLGLAGVRLLRQVAHDALPSTFVLYAGFRYGWDARAMGLFMAAIGVASMIVSGTLVGPIVSRLGERRAVLAGLAFGAAGFFAYGLAPTGALCLLGVPLHALWAIDGPAMQGLMTRRVSASEQGQLQGAGASLMGLGALVAPGLFTQIFAHAIDPARAAPLPGAPFLLAGAIITVAMLFAWRVTAPRAEGVAPEARTEPKGGST
jgi:DHA1 family tetracycline resistance protein-like MFS transporter